MSHSLCDRLFFNFIVIFLYNFVWFGFWGICWSFNSFSWLFFSFQFGLIQAQCLFSFDSISIYRKFIWFLIWVLSDACIDYFHLYFLLFCWADNWVALEFILIFQSLSRCNIRVFVMITEQKKISIAYLLNF